MSQTGLEKIKEYDYGDGIIGQGRERQVMIIMMVK
jgi:hypothetical protein